MGLSDPFSTTYEGARQGVGAYGQALQSIAQTFAERKQKQENILQQFGLLKAESQFKQQLEMQHQEMQRQKNLEYIKQNAPDILTLEGKIDLDKVKKYPGMEINPITFDMNYKATQPVMDLPTMLTTLEEIRKRQKETGGGDTQTEIDISKSGPSFKIKPGGEALGEVEGQKELAKERVKAEVNIPTAIRDIAVVNEQFNRAFPAKPGTENMPAYQRATGVLKGIGASFGIGVTPQQTAVLRSMPLAAIGLARLAGALGRVTNIEIEKADAVLNQSGLTPAERLELTKSVATQYLSRLSPVDWKKLIKANPDLPVIVKDLGVMDSPIIQRSLGEATGKLPSSQQLPQGYNPDEWEVVQSGK